MTESRMEENVATRGKKVPRDSIEVAISYLETVADAIGVGPYD